ncbi:hypothetical protein AB0B45_50655 [Nonomuraea sp. NPDC049152]|uniref:hypothetical protein n=1 Tax=Nonomuraea sp. NPDC049152 TaxID=3154350 RepID=UPI0033DC3238
MVSGTTFALVIWQDKQGTYHDQFWDLAEMKPLGPSTTTLYDALAIGEGVVVAAGPGEQLTMWLVTP